MSGWLVDAIEPQPGHRVLELAAGPGDTGLLAAELIKPGGTLISTDAVEAMVEIARARAAELGIDNAEFRTMDAEWLDLPTASIDGVIARWGYMLLADPATALGETRRVLRPGGRVALAAWTGPEDNPWSWVPLTELVRIGAIESPDLDVPNMFAFRDPDGPRLCSRTRASPTSSSTSSTSPGGSTTSTPGGTRSSTSRRRWPQRSAR